MISQQILDNSGGLLEVQQEPTDVDYIMFNTGGVECEVGEFLYGLIRMIKPELVLETGTHKGVGAAYMGSALRDNNKGKLITVEFEPQHVFKAQELFAKLNLENYINSILDDVKNLYFVKERIDLILLDTEPHFRFGEYLKFWKFLSPGGILVIHDLHPNMGQTGVELNGVMDWPFGTIPEEMKKILKEEAQCFHFRTPRGIFVCQKKDPEFYAL